jgi:hypothetical protein
MDSPGSRAPALVPPILSISASTPLAGESPQPSQYFVPTHKPNPPILPPPSGLNLSSYSFLLMEKRDREREALERANQGYLKGVASSSRGEPGSSGSPLQPAAKVPDPKRDDSYYGRHGGQGIYSHHPSEGSYSYSHQHHPGASGGYDHPPQGFDGPPQHYSPGPYHSQPYGPPPPSHHYHSSSSTHFGQDPAYGRPQVRVILYIRLYIVGIPIVRFCFCAFFEGEGGPHGKRPDQPHSPHSGISHHSRTPRQKKKKKSRTVQRKNQKRNTKPLRIFPSFSFYVFDPHRAIVPLLAP